MNPTHAADSSASYPPALPPSRAQPAGRIGTHELTENDVVVSRSLNGACFSAARGTAACPNPQEEKPWRRLPATRCCGACAQRALAARLTHTHSRTHMRTHTRASAGSAAHTAAAPFEPSPPPAAREQARRSAVRNLCNHSRPESPAPHAQRAKSPASPAVRISHEARGDGSDPNTTRHERHLPAHESEAVPSTPRAGGALIEKRGRVPTHRTNRCRACVYDVQAAGAAVDVAGGGGGGGCGASRPASAQRTS
jgi:hypothetical protein